MRADSQSLKISETQPKFDLYSSELQMFNFMYLF